MSPSFEIIPRCISFDIYTLSLPLRKVVFGHGTATIYIILHIFGHWSVSALFWRRWRGNTEMTLVCLCVHYSVYLSIQDLVSAGPLMSFIRFPLNCVDVHVVLIFWFDYFLSPMQWTLSIHNLVSATPSTCSEIAFCSISSQKPAFLSNSAVKVPVSQAYRNMGITREPIFFTSDLRDMLLSLQIGSTL